MRDAIDFSASPDPIWQRLRDAARAHAPTGLKSLTLATIGLDGGPQARTVILRDVDPAARELRLHADRTSSKSAELVRDPRAAFCGWDAEAKLQLRLHATVSVHTDDAAADAFWASQPASSLDVYRQGRSSGDRLARPTDATLTLSPQRDRFALLVARVHTIEWLWLGVEGHRRGRWSLYADGAAEHVWLVP